MKIEISNATVAPMTAWLKEAEKTGVRDEEKLRQILPCPIMKLSSADTEIPICRYAASALRNL